MEKNKRYLFTGFGLLCKTVRSLEDTLQEWSIRQGKRRIGIELGKWTGQDGIWTTAVTTKNTHLVGGLVGYSGLNRIAEEKCRQPISNGT